MKSKIAIILIAAFTALVSSEVSAVGLEAYYSFDSIDSGIFADYSGNGNDGINYSATIETDAISGSSLRINGDGSWVDIPNMSLSGDFALSFWAKLDGDINQFDAVVGQEGDGQDVNFYDSRARLFAPGDAIVANSTINALDWVHICLTRSENDLLLYINGTLDAQSNWTGIFEPKAIGRGNTGATTSAWIDELRIYSSSLSGENVRQLIAQDKGFLIHEPYPHHQRSDLGIDVELRWESSSEFSDFRVYFGSTPSSLIDVSGEIHENRFHLPALDWDSEYFWRVDVESDSQVFAGDIFSFKVKEFACYGLGESDYNGDCLIDMQDLSVFASIWLESSFLDAFGTLAESWLDEGKQASSQKIAERLNDPAIYERGLSHKYSGENLTAISFPVGGIGSGCIQMDGDAVRSGWQIFNNFPLVNLPDSFFAIRAKKYGDSEIVKALQTVGNESFAPMDSLEFVGEYPIGRYDFIDAQLPVSVSLTAQNPLIPLDTKNSAIPVAIYSLTATNTSDTEVEVSFLAAQENAVGFNGYGYSDGPAHAPSTGVVLADFEGSYAAWTTQGNAFGISPSQGTAPNQQAVSGFLGSGLVNTFDDLGDSAVGVLTSPEFTISMDYIYFLVAGGMHESSECVELIINNEVVFSTTGDNTETLEWEFWNVSHLKGLSARIRIVDEITGAWGHICVDHIVMSDEYVAPMELPGVGENRNQILVDGGNTILYMTSDKAPSAVGSGSMALMTNASGASAIANWSSVELLYNDYANDGELSGSEFAGPTPENQSCAGAIATSSTLQPGETVIVTYILAWHFPNYTHGADSWSFDGNMYSNWWSNALEVANYVSDNFSYLRDTTQLYHDSLYSSNLPIWLLDRISSQVSVARSKTAFWAKNGDYAGWEGCAPEFGLGTGTCTHVWQYAQAHARLFPSIAKKIREQSLRTGSFFPDGGISHRHQSGWIPAADGQCGEILGFYREYLCSSDSGWLLANWTDIKKAMEYTIATWDFDEDGQLSGAQWNTQDNYTGGNNTWIGSLYLAALAASEEMANIAGDTAVASRYASIRISGAQLQDANLWNGEYYIQKPAPAAYDDYNNGCIVDQLLGVWWADQLDLEIGYPRERVTKAFESLMKYNFRADFVGFEQKPRKYVDDADAGLLITTWPSNDRPLKVPMYSDEAWSGLEYPVAAAMISHGLLTEGLTVMKAVYDRYDGRLRGGLIDGVWNCGGNPFADVEWGDFYARPMSVWSVLLAAQGYIYDGPAGRIGFKPAWQKQDHTSFFTAAQGWGRFSQKLGGYPKNMSRKIMLDYGQLRLREIVFEKLPNELILDFSLTKDGETVAVVIEQEADEFTLKFASDVILEEGSFMELLTVVE